MLSFLQRPWVNGSAALVVFGCGTFLAAGPQFDENIAVRWYVAAIVVAVIFEIIRTGVHMATVHRLHEATQATEHQLGTVSQEAIRLAIKSVVEKDEVLRDLGFELAWAARVCSSSRAQLLVLESNTLRVDRMPLAESTWRHVSVVVVPRVDGERTEEIILCASDIQKFTGLRFEIFYRWPKSEVEGTGIFFGHKLMDGLIKDDMVGFIGNKLTPSAA